MDGTRTPQPGERMKVHVNLHKKRLSVTDPRVSLVIGYVNNITMSDVEFRVQAKGHESAVLAGQRQVYAYAIGTVTAVDTEPDVSAWHRITLRKLADAFTFHQRLSADEFTEEGVPVESAPLVVFADLAGWVPPDTRHLGDGRLGTQADPAPLTLFG
jgi:hypothetical protein